VEDVMPRTLPLFAACALTLLLGLPGHSQDPPSLGDLARQAQKDKSNAPARKVITNEDLPSGSVLGSSGSGSILGGSLNAGLGPATTSSKPGAAASPLQSLDRMEATMNRIDSLDRATLVKNVLRGADSDFPGRAKWEERLIAAKQVYVSRGRDLVDRGKQLLASSDSLKGNHDSNDPRVKQVGEQLKELVRDAVRADAAFQAVMLEGRDLASQAPSH
jgi:hypothetical protein